MKLLIAIDPGQDGAIAFHSSDGRTWVEEMEDTLRDIKEQLEFRAFVWIENVGGYHPGNSGPSAVKFARHVGNLEGILTGLGIPFDFVTAKKWEHWLIGAPNYPKIPSDINDKSRRQLLAKRKRERKTKIKAKIQRLYPDQNVTLKTADALGILHWARNGATNGV